MKSATDGIVYLVGSGPGDPGLITLRGVECLQRADVVVYDYLANERLLDHAPPSAERIYAGKIGGRHNKEQDEINALLVAKGKEGKVVVRLKGGDPFVFGRGGEECEALREAGVPFEIVPGVTAAIGAAAYAGIPLTHRAYTASVTLVTGREGEEKDESSIDWARLSHGNGTIVFYMGVKTLRRNMELLMENGKDRRTPVALIRWGATPRQRVLTGTVADIADRAERDNFKPPAITVVGDVVTLRDRLRWFDDRPLFGKRIMVTRAAAQAGEFSAMLSGRGAMVIECPTIRFVEPEQWDPLDAALGNFSGYAWVILTSGNAVRALFRRLDAIGLDARAFGGCRVCAVGPRTAEAIRSFGIRADLTAADYRGEGVVAEFSNQDINGMKILYPRGDLAREAIPTELEKMGARVDRPVIYRTLLPDRLNPEAVFALEKRSVDCITFTSSSTVKNLAQMMGEDRMLDMLRGVVVASIGPVTSRSCRELGLRVDIEPSEPTLAALTDAVEAFLTT